MNRAKGGKQAGKTRGQGKTNERSGRVAEDESIRAPTKNENTKEGERGEPSTTRERESGEVRNQNRIGDLANREFAKETSSGESPRAEGRSQTRTRPVLIMTREGKTNAGS